MQNINKVGNALKTCRANPCDTACDKCAYKGESGCVEKLHKDALMYLWVLGSQVIGLAEKVYGKGEDKSLN